MFLDHFIELIKVEDLNKSGVGLDYQFLWILQNLMVEIYLYLKADKGGGLIVKISLPF